MTSQITLLNGALASIHWTLEGTLQDNNSNYQQLQLDLQEQTNQHVEKVDSIIEVCETIEARIDIAEEKLGGVVAQIGALTRGMQGDEAICE